MKIDPIQNINRSGVDSIPLKTGNKYFLYIGMTLIKFQERLKKQDADLRMSRTHHIYKISTNSIYRNRFQ